MAADAADQDETAAGLLQVLEGRVDRPENSKDVGLELAAVVVERKALERPADPEPRVGDDDVELAERGPGAVDGTLEVAVPGDVTGDHHGPAPGLRDLGRQRLEPIEPARRQRHVSALAGEFAGQGGADARRCARDEDRVAGKALATFPQWRAMGSGG